ncbi:MAG: alpha/beta fold hydrolase [Lewinellaceae bacterium]|nr:alpha/beta fold hydrolase [Lewinellaceae bacterium]
MSSFSPARIMGFFLNTLAAISPRLAGQLGFYLFGLPVRKRKKPQEMQYLATADLQFVRINGKKIAVYHWGFMGPIVLLAHGWESHAGRWRKVAPLLVQAGFQVVAVDAPAHGRSEGRHFTMLKYADVLRAVFQRFGPIDTVIGHSVGGAALIWAMGTLSPALRPRQAVILASFSTLHYIMENARKLVGASDTLMRAMDDYIERVTGHRISYYSIAHMAEKLGDVEALLIHDRHDRVTAFRESESLVAAWPGARFMVTEGFGHGLTAPQVVSTVLEFVHGEAVGS